MMSRDELPALALRFPKPFIEEIQERARIRAAFLEVLKARPWDKKKGDHFIAGVVHHYEKTIEGWRKANYVCDSHHEQTLSVIVEALIVLGELRYLDSPEIPDDLDPQLSEQLLKILVGEYQRRLGIWHQANCTPDSTDKQLLERIGTLLWCLLHKRLLWIAGWHIFGSLRDDAGDTESLAVSTFECIITALHKQSFVHVTHYTAFFASIVRYQLIHLWRENKRGGVVGLPKNSKIELRQPLLDLSDPSEDTSRVENLDLIEQIIAYWKLTCPPVQLRIMLLWLDSVSYSKMKEIVPELKDVSVDVIRHWVSRIREKTRIYFQDKR